MNKDEVIILQNLINLYNFQIGSIFIIPEQNFIINHLKKNGILVMDLSNKQINLKNIFFSTLPGLISIVLTLISLPIYLKFLSPSYYSSFLISHIFMSLSLVFNFNIGKVASIKIQNKTKINKNKIIINAIYLSFIISVLVSFVAVFFLSFIFNNENEINFKLIFLGLVISILFINAEAILKGLVNLKL